ncbi:MAG: glycosyltransferase [Deltaproteobacteria bacterium]|nr:glycosyltransferase [Deltaproteobacteria bacterium]
MFVTPYVPSRLRPRPLHLIEGLVARGHRVALCTAASSAGERDQADALRGLCTPLRVVDLSSAPALWRALRALGRRTPMQAAYCASPALARQVRAVLAAERYDLVHVEHLRAALPGVVAAGPVRVFDAVDCMSRLHAQAAQRGPSWASRTLARLELAPTQRFERQLLRRVDGALVTTELERHALRAVADADAAPIGILPNGVDTSHFTPPAVACEPQTLVFVGRMAYHANQAALAVLLDEVMPRVWAQRPQARLLVVGADPPHAVRARVRRAGARVSLSGSVADVRPWLARATLAVCPLPYAVGIQNKLLEAMAMALPVVVSPIAAAALTTAASGRHLLIEGEPDRFAAAVLQLLDDPAAAARLGAAARAYVQAEHQWPRLVARLEALYGAAIAAGTRGAMAAAA